MLSRFCLFRSLNDIIICSAIDLKSLSILIAWRLNTSDLEIAHSEKSECIKSTRKKEKNRLQDTKAESE